MKYSADALKSITIVEAVEVTHPCRITHNLLQAIVKMQQIVEERGGTFEDDPKFRPLYYDVASYAAELLSDEDTGRELDALRSTLLDLDLWKKPMGSSIINAEPLDVAGNLKITLRAVYTELLKRVAAFAERAA